MTVRDQDKRLICLGAVAGAFGIRGEVRLKSFAEPPENLSAYGPLITEPGGEALVIKTMRPVKGGFAARIEGVDNRTQAESLRGKRLCVERSALPGTESGEFYHVDLVGMAAEDEAGRQVGAVSAVLNFGAGDILEIARAGARDGDGEKVMVPFTEDSVPVVDVENHRVVIRHDEALIADQEEQGETT
ncbi:MAG: ribosome maturation factor RimM [Sphingomonadales bacterium]